MLGPFHAFHAVGIERYMILLEYADINDSDSEYGLRPVEHWQSDSQLE